MARQSSTVEHLNHLLDLARESPRDGFTYADAAARFHWPRPYWYRLVRKARETLAPEKETLLCQPQGGRELWRYRLTADPEMARAWFNNRFIFTGSHVQTLLNVASTMVNATDARSLDGQRMRLLRRSLTRLQEDLEELGGRQTG